MENKKVFQCKILTPLILSRGDGFPPEIRAEAIKSNLRYWWRALHPNLSKEVMRDHETLIFGGTGTPRVDGRRSVVNIHVFDEEVEFGNALPLDHSDDRKKAERTVMPAVVGGEFKVELRLDPAPFDPLDKRPYEEYTYEYAFEDEGRNLSRVAVTFKPKQLFALFRLGMLVGGLGKRGRRGFGSIQVMEGKGIDFDYISKLFEDLDLRHSFSTMSFPIAFNFGKNAPPFPYMIDIQTSQTPFKTGKDLTLAVGEATSQTNNKYKREYWKGMGGVIPKRFSSPVHVSCFEEGNQLKPIVTRVKTCLPDGEVFRVAPDDIQMSFINLIK